MKLPITSWKNTFKSLGYQVVRKPGVKHCSQRGSQRSREKNSQSNSYQLLEPRQLLAADTLIHVVDRGDDLSFQYSLSGNPIDSFSLQNSNNARGAATSPDGSTLYVIDSTEDVYVFDTETDAHLGTWRANGLSSVEGIATDGTHLWIVDKSRDRVYFYAHAADNRWGPQSANGQFDLEHDNKQPSGITTDGNTIWVVDEKDQVYVYDTEGNSLGDWELDSANDRPKGIAIDPSGGDGIWVVDEKDDRVYYYAQGRDQTSGYHPASSSFSLDSDNKNAEGIAISPSTAVDPPSVPTINSITDDTGISNTDGLTNDPTLLISGTADPGTIVTLTETNVGLLGAATVDSSGNWIVDATSITLPDGQYSVTATASNGTETSDPSAPFAITIDTTPTSNLAVLRVDQDSGFDDSDGITRDNTIIVSGITEPNVLITLSESALGQLGTAVADSGGNWSVDVTSNVLPDGLYIFRATATDNAGNTTLPSAPLAIVIDTSAPTSPAITGISDDTGSSAIDGVTSNPVQTISGTAEPNAVITLTDDVLGVIAIATSDSGGDWSVEETFAESVYYISATATDKAGNESAPSSAFALVVDQTSPVAPTIEGFDTDSGSTGDGITNDDTLIFHGTAEAGTIVTLLESTLGALGTVVTDASGTWDLDVTGISLVDGSYLFSATSEDLAGNLSAESQLLSVVVDTIAPGTPSITRVDDDSGLSNSDRITNDNTLTFTGMAAAGATVRVSEPTIGSIGTAVADASGIWLLDATSTILPDGSYLFSAVAEDAAGNSSPSSVPFSVEIDTVAPGQATIVNIDSDTGSIPDDGITSDTTLVFKGTADPGAIVTLTETVLGFVGTGTADGSGAWQIDATDPPLVDGAYSFSVSSADLAGNVGPNSAPFDIVVDTLSPGTPSIVRADDDTGQSDTDGVTNDNTLVFTGMAAPNAIVSVFETTMGFIGSATADNSGVWILDATSTVLADGVYVFTAIAEDVAGNMSPVSAPLNIEVDTIAPTQVVITSIDDDTGSISNDGITSDNTLLFNGTAEPGTVVTLSETVLGPIGTATADEAGLWQIDATATPFADGNYNFSATSEDAAGNTSAVSAPFGVIVDTAGPAAPSIVRVDDDNGASDFDGVTNDNTLVFAGMAMPNSAVSVFEATLGLIGVTSANGSGAWTLDATSMVLADAVYEFTAIAEDTAGNTSPTSNALTVEVDTVVPAQPAIASIDSDSGAVPDDGITNDNTLLFHGTAEADTVVMLSETVLGNLGTATADGAGLWQIDATTTLLADGGYSFSVKSEDLAGNVSADSVSFDVVVDTMAPSVPSILRVNDDTGASDTDSVTNDNTLHFIGMAAPESIVKVFEVTLGLIGTTTANSAGVWSLDATAHTLNDGSYQFSATAEDIAGNVSAASVVLDVVVDTTTPIQPVVDGITDDTGSSASDGVTNDNTLILSGTAEALTEVTISDPVFGVLGTTIADAAGNWQLDASSTTLVDGTYHFTVSSSDLAGNTSQSDVLVVLIDTAAPDVPSIVAVNDDNGASDSDGVTNDSTLSITGLAEANAFVRVIDTNLGLVGTTMADATGVWTLNLPAVQDGNYEFTATAEDLAGNLSGASDSFVVVVDTVAPQTPTLDLDPLFDSAPVGDKTTDLPVVTLNGTTEPGAAVVLSLDLGPVGGPIGDTVADANGDFSFVGVSLSPGPNQFYVFATDLAGNYSVFNQTITNSSTDTDPPIVFAELLNDTGLDSNDMITTDPTLVGFVDDASPLRFVDFYLYSVVLGEEFYVEITPQLVDGEFELDQAFLNNLVGGLLPYGQYYFCVDAEDVFGNYDYYDGEFLYVETDLGDVTPPDVTVELLNDTGPSDTDRETSDGSLTGTVFDESPVMLTVSIANFDDLESGNNHEGDVTDLLQPDGSYIIPQSRLELILGRPLGAERYFITVEANDQFQVGGDGLNFDYILLASPPVITSVVSDTGVSNSDGVTSDNTLTIAGTADPSTDIELFEATFGSLGTTTSDSNGDWSFTLSGPGLVDGVYEFTAFANSSGEPSDASNVFSVTVDTESPLRATFDLDPAFDTGVIGDSYTTTGLVTLSGTTLPSAEVRLLGTGLSTFADAAGNFSLPNVQLDLGRRIYEIVTADAAGNETVSRKSIAYDQPIALSESGFVTQATQLIDLGQDIGVRTVSLRVDAVFGASPVGLEDSFHVYLVDPADTSSTLLDRGTTGTSLFSLIGDQADYLPGRVRFDGSVVEIDVSSVVGFSEGMLLFQLINNDGDTSTTISISNLGSIVDEDGLVSPVAAAPDAVDPGAPFDVSGLAASSGLTLLYENIRYDWTTNRYIAEIRVRNDGPDLGRSIAVTFDSLAGDVTFLNASGNEASGNPYVSLREAIPNYGLLKGQISDAVRVEFIAPSVSPFAVSPIVSDGGANSAPVLDPIGTINVTPGDVVRIELSATDADGEGFYYTINSAGDLPNTTLTATGQLVIAPSPDQIGNYAFEILATDGVLSSPQPVTLNVVADPVTTTRVSGLIMDTNSVPLAGIPVDLGGTTVLTATDGSFELEFVGALPDDTLKVHGETYAGPEVYPFIAEKLPLLYGHDAYENVNNFIERPIYLPALDVANGVTIDPAVDVTVTTPTIPNASVFVAAGTLDTQGGGPFTGQLSITEVPADFTPAALPSDLFPDMVVTIQPGEMVFTTPAPLNLPNLAGYLPGTEMTLWSINPNTGLFDNVGVGVVSADGTTVETVSGGINNSSWHFFAVAGPVIKDPNSNPLILDKECDECELTDMPNDDNAPQENNEADGGDIPLNTDSVGRIAEALSDPHIYNPSPAAGSGSRGRGGRRTGGLDGGWGSGGSMMMSGSADFGPYGSWGGSSGASVSFGASSGSNVTPSNNPLLAGNDRNANDTAVALHSGAVYKSHDLTPYQSLSSWHGLKLNYDSECADARPIISTGFNNIQNNLPDPTLATKLSLSRGNLRMEVPGFAGIQSGLTGGEHFFSFPQGATSLDVAIQADMRSMPTGVYEFESTNRFAGDASGSFTGTASVAKDRLIHINTMASPFGAGWGLSGLLEIVENPDGSALVVDGDGGEYLFEAPTSTGEAYDSPAGDFSTLIKLGDGRFQRTHVDQTVELYSLTNKLTSITDRNGNVTQFQYDGSDNIEFIIDPVGLTTIFRYTGGQVTEIENPAGSVTTLTYQNGNLVSIQDPDTSARGFSYDSLNRLTGEVDKLGETESLQYGFSGRIESIMRKDGSTVSYSPVQTKGLSRADLTSNVASQVPASDFGSQATAGQVDANGNVTQFELDKQGQLLESSDAEGGLPEVTRNHENLVERVVDGRGNLTIINYDERGNVISISDVISRGAATDPLFSDPIYPVVQYTNELVAADINGDGIVDVISQSGTLGDSVSVQLGSGAGGFSIGTTYTVFDPVSLQVADVNNDGNLDVVTTNVNNQISVLLGNGDGTLQDALSYATGVSPQKIQAADFNRDGFVDLVTTDNGGDTVSVLLGDGTGQFNSFTSFTVADSPRSMAIGDINNDNILDIVVGNDGAANGLSILVGNGDGSFAASTFVATDAETEFVVLADVTGDADLDVVTGDSDLVMLPGQGDGTFGSAEVTTTGSTPGSFKSVRAIAIDVDLDGDQDLVFADSSIAAMLVFENDGSGSFTQGQTIAAGGSSMTAADVNFDGVDDIVTLAGGIVSVIGIGDGTFVEPLPPSNNSIPVGDGPSSVAVADFNNDGHEDIVVGGAQLDSTINVMLGAGDGTLTPMIPIASAGLVISVAASDLDGDGNVDVVTSHYDSDSIEVRYGDGLGGFAAPISIAFPSQGPLEVKIGDFNNDSNLDIVTVGYRGAADPGFAIAFSNGDRTFNTGPLIGATFQAGTIDVGDINEDGNLDVVVGVSYFSNGNAARPYFGNGDGTFVDQGRIPFGGGSFAGPPKQLKLVDLDNDGDLDIVGVDEAQNGLKVLNGTGNGTFETVVSYAMDSVPRTLDVGDINNDGILDVIATNLNSDRVSIFFGQNNGTLASRQDFAVGDGPYGVKLVDLDEDGSLDFVTADAVADAISIRINSTDIANQAAQVFEYDSVFSQVTRSIDEEGRVVIYDIDPANGNTLSMTQVIGALGGGDDIVMSYTYTSNGLLDTVTDPLGRVTDMDYNVRGLLERVTFAVGTADEAFITYEYDAAGNQTAIIDELAHRTEYVYDALNRVTQVIEADPDGAGPLASPVTTNFYDDHGNLTSATDALNNTSQFVYDEQHRLIETIDANLESIRHEYDQSGNLAATIDRLGRRTEFVYDQRNRLMETVDAEGGRSSKAYDEDNNVVAMVDENGVTTRYVFDARSRLVRTTDALGGTVRYQYDRVDNLVAATDEIGRRTEMTFDELDRMTTTMLPDPDKSGPQLAPVTTFVYDDATNVVMTIDALGNTTVMDYDERDRLVQMTESDPDGAGPLASPTWNNDYDDANRLIRSTDPLGRETSYVYDDLNRLVTATLPDPDGIGPDSSPQMTYTYDAVFNRRTVTDALGNTTVIGYDDLYRVVSTTDADPDGAGPLLSPVTSFVLDAEGQVESVIDPLGRTTVFTYDLLGRVVTETLPDPDGAGPDSSPVFTHEYDGVGNELLMTDALGNVSQYVYDDLYRLVQMIEPDPDGVVGPELNPTTVMKYDAAHQLVSTADPLNRTTSFEYDDLGRVIRETYPDADGAGPDVSPVMTYVYDRMNNQLSMTDALGNTTAYEYDNLYRLVKTTDADPDGAGPLLSPETTYAYDIASQLLSVSDPLDRTTTYEYDDLGRVIRETYPDPDGAGPDVSPVMIYVYDLMNNQLSMTDALGNTTAYEYDNLYRLVSTTEADPDGVGPESNPVTTYAYDVASQLTSMTDALGRVTSMEYDDLGRVVRTTEPDPDGAGPSAAPEMTYVYDLMDNQLSMTDALGNVTGYEYDNLYRTTKVIQADPDGAGPQTNPTSTFDYDIASQVTSTTDPLGRVTSYVYDDLGRVVREIYPDPDGVGPLLAPEMTYVFDLMNNQLSMTDAVGNVTQYEYDNLYRLTRLIETDPDGTGPLANPVTEYSFDIASQLLATTDPLNRTTTNEYDDLGRVIRMIQPDPDGAGPLAAPETSYVYDLMNNQLSMTDPLGHLSQYEYDNLYRVAREIGEDLDGAGPLTNPTTDYAYDLVDNLLTLTDSSGNQTQYSYDDLDRLFEETIELGSGNFETRQFEYDLEDNLIRRTDRNDRVIEFDYDAIYRMVEERWLDASSVLVNTIQFEFDEASQMLRAEDLTIGSRYDYTYDDLSRVTQAVINNGGPTVVIANAYDAQSRRVVRTASVGGIDDYQNVYSYDGLNRLSGLDQIGQPGGNAVADKRIEFGYNADDQLTLISQYKDVAGGVGNLVMQSAYGYDGIGRLNDLIHSSSVATIVDYDWTYDAASRITQFTNSVDGASDFNYDNTDQLTGATHATQADETYEYDEDGNRTNSGYSTGFYNRLDSDGIFNYEYDAEGNRTKRTNIATGAVTEYDWDHRNRLVSVTERASEGGAATQAVEHRYDVFNRWISKTVDADGDGPVISETTHYEYDGNQIVLTIDDSGTVTNRYLWGPGVDQLLADEQVGDQVYWAAADHLGSVRDVVDSNGAVANHIVYDSFGNVFSETNVSVEFLFGYTGRPFDEATGLQNNLNRWYDAATGRWVSEDPIAFQAGDANLYRYVGNRSPNSIDPKGLDEFWARSKRGFDRMGSALVWAGISAANKSKTMLQQTKSGRFGLELGETTQNLSSTGGKFAIEVLPYTFEKVAPAVGELAAIQGAKLVGKPELAERIRRNSRFSQTLELERYIAKHGVEKTRAMLEEAMVYADISAHVYTGEKGDTIQGFDLMKRHVDNIWENSGFQAATYYNAKTGKYILAFEGTNPALASLDGRRDICQDAKQGFGRKTEQYELAIKLAGEMKKLYGNNLMLTGHSLGGGLATAAALVHKIPAYVIDPAGVHPNTIGRHGADFSQVDELVNGIRLHGEFLTTFVNTAPGAAPTRGAINTIPASKFHDSFSGHSSALAALYLRDLLGIPQPPEN